TVVPVDSITADPSFPKPLDVKLFTPTKATAATDRAEIVAALRRTNRRLRPRRITDPRSPDRFGIPSIVSLTISSTFMARSPLSAGARLGSADSSQFPDEPPRQQRFRHVTSRTR